MHPYLWLFGEWLPALNPHSVVEKELGMIQKRQFQAYEQLSVRKVTGRSIQASLTSLHVPFCRYPNKGSCNFGLLL